MRYITILSAGLLSMAIWTSHAFAINESRHTASPPVKAEGSTGYFSFDLNSNARFTLGTLISGEDQAANVIRVEQQFLSSGTKTADAQIKAAPGYVDVINCYGTDAAAVAGTIILYDNTAESGTILWSWTVGALDYHIPFDHQVHAIAATGIYLGYTTTTDVNCTVSYR